MSALNPLTTDELLAQAPALFTEEPHFEVSEMYHFIPTIDVINEIKQHNWYPTSVQEASVKDASKDGYQRHLVRFRHFEDLEVDPQDLLIPHRIEDEHDDLYTVLNVLQENLLRGNISGINKETGRRFTSREITSISKDVDVNQGLWNIAERIANIKEPALALAA